MSDLQYSVPRQSAELSKTFSVLLKEDLRTTNPNFIKYIVLPDWYVYVINSNMLSSFEFICKSEKDNQEYGGKNRENKVDKSTLLYDAITLVLNQANADYDGTELNTLAARSFFTKGHGDKKFSANETVQNDANIYAYEFDDVEDTKVILYKQIIGKGEKCATITCSPALVETINQNLLNDSTLKNKNITADTIFDAYKKLQLALEGRVHAFKKGSPVDYIYWEMYAVQESSFNMENTTCQAYQRYKDLYNILCADYDTTSLSDVSNDGFAAKFLLKYPNANGRTLLSYVEQYNAFDGNVSNLPAGQNYYAHSKYGELLSMDLVWLRNIKKFDNTEFNKAEDVSKEVHSFKDLVILKRYFTQGNKANIDKTVERIDRYTLETIKSDSEGTLTGIRQTPVSFSEVDSIVKILQKPCGKKDTTPNNVTGDTASKFDEHVSEAPDVQKDVDVHMVDVSILLRDFILLDDKQIQDMVNEMLSIYQRMFESCYLNPPDSIIYASKGANNKGPANPRRFILSKGSNTVVSGAVTDSSLRSIITPYGQYPETILTAKKQKSDPEPVQACYYKYHVQVSEETELSKLIDGKVHVNKVMQTIADAFKQNRLHQLKAAKFGNQGNGVYQKTEQELVYFPKIIANMAYGLALDKSDTTIKKAELWSEYVEYLRNVLIDFHRLDIKFGYQLSLTDLLRTQCVYAYYANKYDEEVSQKGDSEDKSQIEYNYVCAGYGIIFEVMSLLQGSDSATSYIQKQKDEINDDKNERKQLSLGFVTNNVTKKYLTLFDKYKKVAPKGIRENYLLTHAKYPSGEKLPWYVCNPYLFKQNPKRFNHKESEIKEEWANWNMLEFQELMYEFGELMNEDMNLLAFNMNNIVGDMQQDFNNFAEYSRKCLEYGVILTQYRTGVQYRIRLSDPWNILACNIADKPQEKYSNDLAYKLIPLTEWIPLDNNVNKDSQPLLPYPIAKDSQTSDFRVIEYGYLFNTNAVESVPAFAYKEMMRNIDNGYLPKWQTLPVGRTFNNAPVTLAASSNGQTKLGMHNKIYHLIIAGSRSGKGVNTFTYLATAMLNGRPVFYLDNKPDMASTLYSLVLEIYQGSQEDALKNSFIFNGGQYEGGDDASAVVGDSSRPWQARLQSEPMGFGVPSALVAPDGQYAIPRYLFDDGFGGYFFEDTYSGNLGTLVYYRVFMFLCGILYALYSSQSEAAVKNYRSLLQAAGYSHSSSDLSDFQFPVIVVDEINKFGDEESSDMASLFHFINSIIAPDKAINRSLKNRLDEKNASIKADNAGLKKDEKTPNATLDEVVAEGQAIPVASLYARDIVNMFDENWDYTSKRTNAGDMTVLPKDESNVGADMFLIGQNASFPMTATNRISGFLKNNGEFGFKEGINSFTPNIFSTVTLQSRNNAVDISLGYNQPFPWYTAVDDAKLPTHDKLTVTSRYFAYVDNLNPKTDLPFVDDKAGYAKQQKFARNAIIYKPYLILNSDSPKYTEGVRKNAMDEDKGNLDAEYVYAEYGDAETVEAISTGTFDTVYAEGNAKFDSGVGLKGYLDTICTYLTTMDDAARVQFSKLNAEGTMYAHIPANANEAISSSMHKAASIAKGIINYMGYLTAKDDSWWKFFYDMRPEWRFTIEDIQTALVEGEAAKDFPTCAGAAAAKGGTIPRKMESVVYQYFEKYKPENISASKYDYSDDDGTTDGAYPNDFDENERTVFKYGGNSDGNTGGSTGGGSTPNPNLSNGQGSDTEDNGEDYHDDDIDGEGKEQNAPLPAKGKEPTLEELLKPTPPFDYEKAGYPTDIAKILAEKDKQFEQLKQLFASNMQQLVAIQNVQQKANPTTPAKPVQQNPSQKLSARNKKFIASKFSESKPSDKTIILKLADTFGDEVILAADVRNSLTSALLASVHGPQNIRELKFFDDGTIVVNGKIPRVVFDTDNLNMNSAMKEDILDGRFLNYVDLRFIFDCNNLMECYICDWNMADNILAPALHMPEQFDVPKMFKRHKKLDRLVIGQNNPSDFTRQNYAKLWEEDENNHMTKATTFAEDFSLTKLVRTKQGIGIASKVWKKAGQHFENGHALRAIGFLGASLITTLGVVAVGAGESVVRYTPHVTKRVKNVTGEWGARLDGHEAVADADMKSNNEYYDEHAQKFKRVDRYGNYNENEPEPNLEKSLLETYNKEVLKGYESIFDTSDEENMKAYNARKLQQQQQAKSANNNNSNSNQNGTSNTNNSSSGSNGSNGSNNA